MCGDFVQMLNCALWGWRGPAFFSLRMLISLMEPEQSADAQDRMSFFLCAVVGYAVFFPIETHFQWSCSCVKINQNLNTVLET